MELYDIGCLKICVRYETGGGAVTSLEKSLTISNPQSFHGPRLPHDANTLMNSNTSRHGRCLEIHSNERRLIASNQIFVQDQMTNHVSTTIARRLNP